MRTQKFTEAWFPIENDPDETEFRIKHLRAKEKAKITGQTHLQRFEFKKNDEDVMTPVPILEMDNVKAKGMAALEAVTGWKNVYIRGELAEYSAKNKAIFFDELSEADYVAAIAHIEKSQKVLADQIAAAEDERLGKSESGQGGLPVSTESPVKDARPLSSPTDGTPKPTK
jgi:hypothetical protein